ncbi:MAG: stage V sporulation protein AA [Bacillota bacterium]|nr:stage V sporulation protein AA [Bacillota bacterium]
MPTVYLKPRDSLIVAPGEDITLGMLAEFAAEDHELERTLRGQPFLPGLTEGHGAISVSSLDLVRAIRRQRQDLDLRIVGPAHTVVKPRVRPNPVMAGIWTAAVTLLLFFGSLMAIMFFHADVDMPLVHRGVYQLVTGEAAPRPLVLQIPYSIGVGVGVLLFFNSLSRRKPSSDPSPLDVQMHIYDQDAQDYLVSQSAAAHRADQARQK